MRELPEPDSRDGRNDAWFRESVLAIQKQAYEDGLRDAGEDAERYRWLRKNQLLAKIHYMPTPTSVMLDTAIDAEITVSQKDQK